jgi:transcription antitermination factor NusG
MNKKHRISEIIKRLDSLPLEANAPTHELRALTQRSDQKEDPNLNKFKKGDQVIITNKYRGQEGRREFVTHTTTKQVTLEDNFGKK